MADESNPLALHTLRPADGSREWAIAGIQQTA